jgi:ornithine carbamoyltransferase
LTSAAPSAIHDLRGRSLLSMRSYEPREVELLLDVAADLKRLRREGTFDRNLEHRSIAAIFLKPSTRTRIAFAVAAAEEGAHLQILSPEDIRFGVKESVADIARVLGRLFDGIALRASDDAVIRALAEHAGVPVWNGLSDLFHPTQALADLLTLREEFGALAGLPLAYVGDGRNNQARSLVVAAAKVGLDLRLLSPPELQLPAAEVRELARGAGETGGKVLVTSDAGEALAGAAAVYTDVWVSMGEEEQLAARVAALGPYRVTPELMARSGRDDTIFLHCLPALHDLETEFARAHPDAREVADEVFESPASRVFDQSENRMHTIKALMVLTVGVARA